MRTHLFVDVPLWTAMAVCAPVYGWWPVAGLAAAQVGLHAWGVTHPRSRWYLPVQYRTAAAGLALTFDDGPDADTTPALLDLLAQHQALATFFVIGQRVQQQPEIVRRIHQAGHSIGLHSMGHHRLYNCFSRARLRSDLAACRAAIADATGAAPAPLMRPPMGLKNPLLALACRDLRLTCVTWTARGLDTRRRATVEQVSARLLRHLVPGAILTLHDGSEPAHPAPRPLCLPATAAVLQASQASRLSCGALHAQGDGALGLRLHAAQPGAAPAAGQGLAQAAAQAS